jgi:hypothetical protein
MPGLMLRLLAPVTLQERILVPPGLMVVGSAVKLRIAGTGWSP